MFQIGFEYPYIMEKYLVFLTNCSETMKIIEALDHERKRWLEIAETTDNADVKMDYEEDILVMDELIARFKKEAKKMYGDNVVKLANAKRGFTLSKVIEEELYDE